VFTRWAYSILSTVARWRITAELWFGKSDMISILDASTFYQIGLISQNWTANTFQRRRQW